MDFSRVEFLVFFGCFLIEFEEFVSVFWYLGFVIIIIGLFSFFCKFVFFEFVFWLIMFLVLIVMKFFFILKFVFNFNEGVGV